MPGAGSFTAAPGSRYFVQVSTSVAEIKEGQQDNYVSSRVRRREYLFQRPSALEQFCFKLALKPAEAEEPPRRHTRRLFALLNAGSGVSHNLHQKRLEKCQELPFCRIRFLSMALRADIRGTACTDRPGTQNAPGKARRPHTSVPFGSDARNAGHARPLPGGAGILPSGHGAFRG